MKHFMMIPFTGLGLYNGFRGNKWLKSRIKIFRQFVVPSLLAQTCQDFTLWVCWRYEEKNNKQVKELKEYLDQTPLKSVFTYSGVPFYDDKYEDAEARDRLVSCLSGAMGALINEIGEVDNVLLTIQPSDDCYRQDVVHDLQEDFRNTDYEALGISKGYIMNYNTLEVKEYNPTTNPPFYTIKFPKDIFVDPLSHAQYTGLKKDVGKYKAGTPIPSHEYVGDALNYNTTDARGFLVGTHGANISTTYNIPFAGEVTDLPLVDFGLEYTAPLKIKIPLKRKLYLSLPYKAQRKIRYWLTEKFK